MITLSQPIIILLPLTLRTIINKKYDSVQSEYKYYWDGLVIGFFFLMYCIIFLEWSRIKLFHPYYLTHSQNNKYLDDFEIMNYD
jgi:hypothetical protein